MKFLTDRKEIAKAINIDGIPVVRIDISKQMDGYDDCYAGDNVVVIHKDGFDTRCKVEMFSDMENENLHSTPYLYKRISLMPMPVCVSSGFGYHDVKEMYEWSKAVRIHEGQEVIVLFDGGDSGYLRKMRVGKASKWVFPTALFEDVD